MSIDLGGEYMKIAIVKPGVPMEIVLNKESSRKTRTIVAFRDGDRHFANEAYNTGVRFPSKAFWFLTHVIGRSYEDPAVHQFLQRFPYYRDHLVQDPHRGTVLFKENQDTLYSTEELLGMMLEKAREYAQDFAEQSIQDAVITVPPYYSQAERRAVVKAADLVGLNVLQLINDNTAAALNYGVFRRKNFNTTAQHFMFYDMGATSTVATVVSYQVVKTKDASSRVDSNPQLTIKGVGYDRDLGGLEILLRMRDHLAKVYDRDLGGLEISLRLRDHLAKVFDSQKSRPASVQDNPRAMAKLLKEAERVKKVLSANLEHRAQVEGLLEGEDFAAKVTREDFLGLMQDLLPRVTRPVEEALTTANISMGEITEIILMGGGSRVPKIQELLLEYSGKSDLGKSINTDEAATLGAVYQAAFLGKGFKVKTFHVRDATLFPINVEFERQKSGEEGARTVRRTLFGRMNPYPQRKVMTFNKHFKDFSFDVRYGDIDFLPDAEKKALAGQLLSNVSLVGVERALGKHGEGEYKGVKAHFRMDDSGLLHLEKVEAVFERQEAPEAPATEGESTWSKIGSAFGGLFGSQEDQRTEEGKEDSSEQGKTETKDEKAEEPRDKEEEEKKEEKEEEKKEEKEEEKKEEKEEEKLPTDEKKSGQAEEKEEKKEEKEGKEEEKGGKEEEKGGKEEEKEQGGEKEGEEKKEKKEEKKEEPKTRTVVVKENIEASVEVKDMADLTGDTFAQARLRLEALQTKDQEKMALGQAKNELEGFIFDTQDKLTQDHYEACSTPEERTHIQHQMSQASDWLYEQPEDSKKEVFTDKLTELKGVWTVVSQRVQEREERPKALEALRHHLNATTHFLATVHNMTDPEDPIFTPVELATLEKLVNETTAWRDEAVKEQAKLADHQNPSLRVEAIGARIYALEREMKYLINKAKTFRPKPKVAKPGNATAPANQTESHKSGKKAKGSKTAEGEEAEGTKTAEGEEAEGTKTAEGEEAEGTKTAEGEERMAGEDEDEATVEEEEEEPTTTTTPTTPQSQGW
ncbi:hypothetical protein ACOMHN_044209 [Nucella lapillus]